MRQKKSKLKKPEKKKKNNDTINLSQKNSSVKTREKKKNLNKEYNSKFNKYIKLNKTIKDHIDWIKSVKIFPSGNLVSVSDDSSIIIYNGLQYNVIQNIRNAHENSIINVSIKDDNNFITCSDDTNIHIWSKKENEFTLNKIIKKAHKNRICNVIYCSNDNIISCSNDEKIKIWELINDEYQLLTTLTHSDTINSLLLLEDKNILISGGYDGTKLWKIYTYGKNVVFLCHFKKAFGGCWNGLCRIDEDRIVVGGEKSLEIISLNKKQIINSIKIPFRCNGITSIEEKGLFFVGGWSYDIQIYRIDNYKCIETIECAHHNYIVGFCKLINGLICSYSADNSINIWSFNK